ncbi:MAG: hypothetical protein DDT34_01320 [Firmicutes bacterium]|nr:hypothetical protein [Bacillota bacterium]MBT9158108.1 hypothetical protein [Bacillota bacterium]
MRDFILENLTGLGTVGLETILLNNAMAMVFSAFLLLIYRITNPGASYSKKFNISLGMMVLVTTMIMSVISGNIALSLGMVGALSIIRFRTAVKDVRDATYIFWAIALGICCGISQFFQAGIGSVAIAMYLVVMKQVGGEGQYLIIIRSLPEVQEAVEAAVDNYFAKSAHLRVRNVARDASDLIYEVSRAGIKKALSRRKTSIAERLMTMEGVISVDQVEQTDGISR